MTSKGGKPYQPPPPGGYETVPLDCDEVKVAAIQMVKVPVDPGNPKEGTQANLRTMLRLCDEAAAQGVRLAVFNEFTLTGHDRLRTREQWLNIAIMLPGPETEAIGKKAIEHNMYIAVANHTQQRDWPGHFFNASFIVGSSGDVIHHHWKAYWGHPGIGVENSTTVYDVLDEFVDRYGWDAVWPVVRTPIGNLATYVCSESFSSEVARSFAINGAEILCRMFGGHGYGNRGGRSIVHLQGDCAFNDCWGVGGNGGTTENETPEKSWSGSALVVNPWGQIVAIGKTVGEEIVTATVPIAEFRTERNRFDLMCKNPHMTPSTARGGLRTDLIAPVYQQHPAQFPPNLLTKYQQEHNGELPPDYDTTREWYFKNARWEFQYQDLPDWH